MATGKRIRYSLSKGRLGAAITSGDTTLDLSVDPGWDALGAGEYIVLTLGDEEIVHVTGYSLGASTCTVERGQEGTVATGHGLGDPWVHAATPQDFDHSELDGTSGDAHPDLLNNTRHDVPARHPVSVLGDGLGFGLRQVLIYTSDANFEKANYPWLRAVRVRLVGGGGAGGGTAATGASDSAVGAGGSAGGYAESVIGVASLGASEAVTVGAGGTGVDGGSGNNGNASSFGAHVAANGGFGAPGTSGAPPIGVNGVDGGAATAGDLQWEGGGGGTGLGINTTVSASGFGGASAFGGGGNSVTQPRDGRAGNAPGSGGSGAASDNNRGTFTGGDGADGIVIVELYG